MFETILLRICSYKRLSLDNCFLLLFLAIELRELRESIESIESIE